MVGEGGWSVRIHWAGGLECPDSLRWGLKCPDSLRRGLKCPNSLRWGAGVSWFTEVPSARACQKEDSLCNGRSPQQTLTIRIISTTRAFPWKNGVTFSPRFPRTFVLSGWPLRWLANISWLWTTMGIFFFKTGDFPERRKERIIYRVFFYLGIFYLFCLIVLEEVIND